MLSLDLSVTIVTICPPVSGRMLYQCRGGCSAAGGDWHTCGQEAVTRHVASLTFPPAPPQLGTLVKSQMANELQTCIFIFLVSRGSPGPCLSVPLHLSFVYISPPLSLSCVCSYVSARCEQSGCHSLGRDGAKRPAGVKKHGGE